MARITNEMRDDIVIHAVAHAFGARKAALAAALPLFADKCYEDAYEAEISRLRLREIPEKWIARSKQFRLVCSGFSSSTTFFDKSEQRYVKTYEISNYMEMSSEQPVSACGRPDTVTIVKDHKLYTEAQTLVKERRAILKGEEALETKLRNLLRSCTSIKQLHAAWPEGKAFIPAEVTYSMALVPVTLTHEINQMLGIESVPKSAAATVIATAARKAKAK